MAREPAIRIRKQATIEMTFYLSTVRPALHVHMAWAILKNISAAVLPYLSQAFLGLLAFFALLKDRREYGKLSRRWGRSVPLVIAIITATVTVLGIYETYSTRVEQAANHATISQLIEQISQLRSDNAKNTDSFRDSFSKLYDRFSNLQSKVQTADLLKEIRDTKQELVETQNKLTPPSITPIASFPTEDAQNIPITEIRASRTGSFVVVHFMVYNPSNYNTKNGAVFLRICTLCTYAEEPAGFIKVVGGEIYDREHDFQHIWAKTAMEDMTVHISVPDGIREFVVGVFVSCENCTPANQQHLKVILQ